MTWLSYYWPCLLFGSLTVVWVVAVVTLPPSEEE